MSLRLVPIENILDAKVQEGVSGYILVMAMSILPKMRADSKESALKMLLFILYLGPVRRGQAICVR